MRRGVLLAALAACAPELVDDTAVVREPRLLAARAEPAEVAPAGEVATSVLWATPDGATPDAPLEWAFCTTRKQLAEPGPIASACLAAGSPDLIVFGSSATATGAVPAIACRQFGPDAPDPLPGEPAGRPVDPDGTGGFYQPIRVRAAEPEESFALAEVRILCGLPGATPAQASEFRAGYIPNTNPVIEAVTFGGAVFTAPMTVVAGATIDLAVRWPACDAAPCGGSEPYLWFDPRDRVLATRREAMRVSWFATAGAFASGHSGLTEDAAHLGVAEGQWTAPSGPGQARLWIVLRDDRGGATWTELAITIE